VLVGEAGVGKTALVEGLELELVLDNAHDKKREITKELRNHRIISLSWT